MSGIEAVERGADGRGWALGAELMSAAAAGLSAVEPAGAVSAALGPPPETGRALVLALGEAAAAMTAATAEAWGARLGDRLGGLVVAEDPAGAGDAFERLAVGPSSSADSLDAAAARLLALAETATAEDLTLVLLSDGVEALASVPAAGVSWAEREGLIEALVSVGAPDDEIELVARRLSALAAGRLAAAASPARVRCLVWAEGVDDPADAARFAGGPTAPDPADLEAARRVVAAHRLRRDRIGALTPPGAEEARLGLPLRPEARRLGQESFHLVESWSPLLARASDPPRPDHPVFAGAELAALGGPAALAAATAAALQAAGWRASVLEAGVTAERLAARTRRAVEAAAPAALVAAWPRSLEAAPELAAALDGAREAAALALAPAPEGGGWRGALALGDTAARAAARGLPLDAVAFEALGDAFLAPSAARRDLGLALIAVRG